jgi:hypothetical protein
MLLKFPPQTVDYMTQCNLFLEWLIDEWLINVVCFELDVLMIVWLPDFAHCPILQTISCC